MFNVSQFIQEICSDKEINDNYVIKNVNEICLEKKNKVTIALTNLDFLNYKICNVQNLVFELSSVRIS